MAGHVEVEVVGEQGLEHDALNPPLLHYRAHALLHAEEAVGQLGPGDHQGLAEHGAVLGAADVEGVAQVGELRQGQIVGLGGEGGPQPAPSTKRSRPFSRQKAYRAVSSALVYTAPFSVALEM